MVGISQEIWCSNRKTARFDEKLGDSQENWESWQVRVTKMAGIYTVLQNTERSNLRIPPPLLFP